MSFMFERLAIPDMVLIEPAVQQDERGWFAEVYKLSAFAGAGIPTPFVQDNHSVSGRGVLRGLHYQRPPKAQGKLVRIVAGEVYDVAVDIRRRSPTFGRWVAVRLSADNRRMLYVPPGFAHGFCVLSDTAEVFYKTTVEYSPEDEHGIIWNDPDLAIAWPLDRPRLSPRDARLPRLKETEPDF